MRGAWLIAALGLALLAGCAAEQNSEVVESGGERTYSASPIPPFASVPFEPFSRQDVVAIAQREWRLFGSKVDDEPERRGAPDEADKPERWPGLWQRVGEYWWEGMDAGSPEAAWTGMHNAAGHVFPAKSDGYYAWSAAFVSYVMRIAGAGPRFPYSANHSEYINAARTGTPLLQAEPPESYAPQPGDLICMGRGRAAKLRFDRLPAPKFPAHCDIVVEVTPGTLSVVGGNVDDAVTMKHVPVDTNGHLATPEGIVLDTRWPWFVVLRVVYDQ